MGFSRAFVGSGLWVKRFASAAHGAGGNGAEANCWVYNTCLYIPVPFHIGAEELPNEVGILILNCHCDSPFCYLSSFPFAPGKEFMGTLGLQQQALGKEVIQSLEGC